MSEQLARPAAPPRRGAWRIVAYVAAALVALDLLVAVNSRLWRDYDPEPYRERLEACRTRPWDLVFVGGSPVTYGVDPAVLSGLRRRGKALDRVYNLGLPLATASEINLSVEHALPDPPPRLLVYGASATDFNEDRVEPHGPRLLMDLQDAFRWSRCRPEASYWCLRQFSTQRFESLWSLYTYRNGIRLWAADEAGRVWPGLCPQAEAEARAGLAATAWLATGNGFQTPPATPENRLDRIKAAGKVDPICPFMEHYRLDRRGYLGCLGRLLETARRRGVEVVLFDVPVPTDLDRVHYPREYAAYRTALAAVAQEHGVHLLSAASETIGLTDADFADAIHLNSDGAARLSAWLRAKLEADAAGEAP